VAEIMIVARALEDSGDMIRAPDWHLHMLALTVTPTGQQFQGWKLCV
jgi:hypothetical protein